MHFFENQCQVQLSDLYKDSTLGNIPTNNAKITGCLILYRNQYDNKIDLQITN